MHYWIPAQRVIGVGFCFPGTEADLPARRLLKVSRVNQESPAPARKAKPDAHEVKIMDAQTELTQARRDVEACENRMGEIKTKLQEERAIRQKLRDVVARCMTNVTRREQQHAKYLVGELTAALLRRGHAATRQAIIAAAKEEHRPRVVAFLTAPVQAEEPLSAETVEVLNNENNSTRENVKVLAEADRKTTDGNDQVDSENPSASVGAAAPATSLKETTPLEASKVGADKPGGDGAADDGPEVVVDASLSPIPAQGAVTPTPVSPGHVPAGPDAAVPGPLPNKPTQRRRKGEGRAAGTAQFDLPGSVATETIADQAS